jgi:hypothetical protein
LKIENCKALSIMYDGATDTSVSEVEIIYVRLLQDGYPKDYFVGLVDLEHAHADGVFTATDTAMNNHGSVHLPDKCVGLIDFSSRDSAIVLNSLSALGE